MKLEELFNTDTKTIKKAVKKIPLEKVRKVIEIRYGLIDGKYNSLQEVADKMNITMENARQLDTKGIRYLKQILPKKTLLEKIKSIFKK